MDLLIDANNNSEKSYSLRPRAAPKKDDEDSEQEDAAKPSVKRRRKPKQKPNRLSKYRRKTANARERSRMREINEAFEALRRSIPHLAPCTDNGEKLTKISTLRLAMKYITALSNALSDSPGESDGESFFSDYCLTPSTPRETSMTPSSISDHSDFYDQFFQKSLTGSVSPCDVSVSTVTTEFNFTQKYNLSVNSLENSSIDTRTFPNSRVSSLDPLPSFYQISTSILGPEPCERVPSSSFTPQVPPVPDQVCRNSSLDLFEAPVQSSPAAAEIDSLLFPSLNFDELFVT